MNEHEWMSERMNELLSCRVLYDGIRSWMWNRFTNCKLLGKYEDWLLPRTCPGFYQMHLFIHSIRDCSVSFLLGLALAYKEIWDLVPSSKCSQLFNNTVINNNTRINSVFLALTTARLLFPYPVQANRALKRSTGEHRVLWEQTEGGWPTLEKVGRKTFWEGVLEQSRFQTCYWTFPDKLRPLGPWASLLHSL